MKVSSIMTNRVATVEMDDTLRAINNIFCQAKFHHLLVVENEKLIGVISDRDLLKASSPFLDTPAERPCDVARLSRKVHQIMTREPITVEANTPVAEAVAILIKKNVSCLPVVSPLGKVEGIVTWKDLLKAYMALQGEAEIECKNCGNVF
jgi:acetoin utilization protein AcuB